VPGSLLRPANSKRRDSSNMTEADRSHRPIWPGKRRVRMLWHQPPSLRPLAWAIGEQRGPLSPLTPYSLSGPRAAWAAALTSSRRLADRPAPNRPAGAPGVPATGYSPRLLPGGEKSTETISQRVGCQRQCSGRTGTVRAVSCFTGSNSVRRFNLASYAAQPGSHAALRTPRCRPGGDGGRSTGDRRSTI
jgi:hypothetical protein